VLLYLLLTKERPYDVRGKTPVEIERIVCEDVPPKPSSKAPAPRQRRLRGDLDLIVMTALQKDERRRYQSPAALAQDLRRFRQGHAIQARPDSARYRLRKFVGRHRVGVTIAALVALALAGAASRERVLRHRAEVQARKATEVEDFLVRVFDVADPESWKEPDGGSVTARELLDRGAGRIEGTLVDQPEVQAELRTVLGRVYTNLGLYDKATPLLQRALAQHTALYGARDARVAATMDLLGTAFVKLDKYGEAEPLLRQALEARRRLLGNMHAATAETIDHLATLLEQRNEFDAAEPLYREVLAIRQSLFGASSVEVANALNNLGLIRYRKGAYAEAESLYHGALAIKLRLGERHSSTAATMQNLAQTLQMLGKFKEAETYHRRALATKRAALGDAHPSVTISLNNLANLLTRLSGRLDEAEALAREALALDRRMFGAKHSYVAASMANLGMVMRLKGEFVAADTLVRNAYAINRELLGEPHERVAYNLANIAQTRYVMGDGAGAIDFMRRSVAQYRKSLGDTHRATVITTGNLGFILAEFGDPVEAESLLRASSSQLDPEHSGHRTQFISNEIALGKALLAQRRTDEALTVLERVVEMAKKEFGDGHYRTGHALVNYGSALAAKGRYSEADAVLRTAVRALEKNRRAQPRLAAQAEAALARLPR
jgi:serine/threonine-protein kinase